MDIQQIRNATLVVTYANQVLLIDPFLGEKGSLPPFGQTPNAVANPLVDLPVDVNTLLDPDAIFVTHLHLDHAGGNTRIANLDAPILDSAEFGAELAFPNATYVVQRGELEFARHTNERTRASYLPKNFEPVSNANRWRLFNGDGEVLPGISLRLTPGHVPHHQCVVVRDQGETAIFLADLLNLVSRAGLATLMKPRSLAIAAIVALSIPILPTLYSLIRLARLVLVSNVEK